MGIFKRSPHALDESLIFGADGSMIVDFKGAVDKQNVEDSFIGRFSSKPEHRLPVPVPDSQNRFVFVDSRGELHLRRFYLLGSQPMAGSIFYLPPIRLRQAVHRPKNGGKIFFLAIIVPSLAVHDEFFQRKERWELIAIEFFAYPLFIGKGFLAFLFGKIFSLSISAHNFDKSRCTTGS